jgi:hypothetical protein
LFFVSISVGLTARILVVQNVFHVVAVASSRNAQRKSKEKDAVNFGQSMRRSNITACDDGPVILAEYVQFFLLLLVVVVVVVVVSLWLF